MVNACSMCLSELQISEHSYVASRLKPSDSFFMQSGSQAAAVTCQRCGANYIPAVSSGHRHVVRGWLAHFAPPQFWLPHPSQFPK
jgi:hypothetical protein